MWHTCFKGCLRAVYHVVYLFQGMFESSLSCGVPVLRDI